MWLLTTSVDNIRLEEYQGENIPPYSILSHTWSSPQEEVTFQDVNDSNRRKVSRKKGWSKIQSACAVAALGGYKHIWIDTCCIDKRNSVELSECINSMFKWYQRAEVCYAHLADVPDQAESQHWHESRWFKRGWTLQELIAPSRLLFFSANWHLLGAKHQLYDLLGSVTSIDQFSLSTGRVAEVSVARRMHWASHRETTKEEDQTYCLLGIFNVNMPLLYGEGAEKAFLRLQQEILKRSDDQSIFVWEHDDNIPEITHQRHKSLLAQSTRDFASAGAVNLCPLPSSSARNLAVTNTEGLAMDFFILPLEEETGINVGLIILDCEIGSTPGVLPAIKVFLLGGKIVRDNIITKVATGFFGQKIDVFSLRSHTKAPAGSYVAILPQEKVEKSLINVNLPDFVPLNKLERRQLPLQGAADVYDPQLFKTGCIRLCISAGQNLAVKRVRSTGYWDQSTGLIQLSPIPNNGRVLSVLWKTAAALIELSVDELPLVISVRFGPDSEPKLKIVHDLNEFKVLDTEWFSLNWSSYKATYKSEDHGLEIKLESGKSTHGIATLYIRPIASDHDKE